MTLSPLPTHCALCKICLSGKNRIKRLEGLAQLKSLDVLDLHSNEITQIENIGHMQVWRRLFGGRTKDKDKATQQKITFSRATATPLCNSEAPACCQPLRFLKMLGAQFLRILNLSGNRIRVVENLEGLTSLIELNLCRNQVEIVQGLGQLKSLKRLFLSTNKISSFHDIRSLLQV